MRHNRSHGHMKIRADFYECKPYHDNSRKAHDAQLSRVLQSVWERALSSRARRARRPPSAAVDDTACPGREGDE